MTTLIQRIVGLARFVIGAALLISGTQAWSQYPERPIRVIVPWPAGAATDSVTRAVSERLAVRLGQPVVVENRPGASGSIGTGVAAKAAPDGYTLTVATPDTHAINPHLFKSLAYDPLKDFEPLVMYGRVNVVWLARSTLAANNIPDLLALAKASPGKVSYGSWGNGSTAHLAGAMLESAGGVEMVHVPFTGAAPAINALLGGHIDTIVYTPSVAVQHQRSGKAKVLGVAGSTRALPLLPDVPTLAEQGVKGADLGSWQGMMVPAGVPIDVRERLTKEIMAVINMPEVSRFIQDQGLEPVKLPPQEFKAFVQDEYMRYGKIISERRIRTDN